MSRIDELRMMTKVARMYYGMRLKQTHIAEQLDISQATISRLIKRALDEQIVRINISIPTGIHSDMESELERIYNLKEAIVVDGVLDDEQILKDIGAAAAYYLEQTIRPGEVIGLSSWSKTLMEMVDAMNPLPHQDGTQVVQILGGVGSPNVERHAVHLIRRLAIMVQGEPYFLGAPGVVGSAEMKQLYVQDQFVAGTLAKFPKITLGLVGVGSIDPSEMLASSGNIFSTQELDELRQMGAVGDVCLRYFDGDGNPIQSALNDRVIGMDLEQMRKIKRSIGVAGGIRKVAAIRGAMRGKYINVLITDVNTASELIGPAANL